MEPVSITITTYIAMKIVDQFIAEEGYSFFKRLFNGVHVDSYKAALAAVIGETVEEHEKKFPYSVKDEKFPFYHSQILFEQLNQHVLFSPKVTIEELLKEFEKNPNISVPKRAELDDFYNAFLKNIDASDALKKLHFKENYQAKIFDIWDSIEEIRQRLTSIDNKWNFPLSQKWLAEQCEASIQDLGNRYTPEINYELDISELFEGLGRTKKFKSNIAGKLDKFLIKGKKLITKEEEIQPQITQLNDSFKSIFTLFESADFLGTKPLPSSEFNQLLTTIEKISTTIYDFYLTEDAKLREDKPDHFFNSKYRSNLNDIREFESELFTLTRLVNSDTFQLASNPFLLLDGEAGIGKSHLIGDIVTNRISNDYDSVLLLGQHLVTNEAPWVQAFKRLQLCSTSNEFLTKLNHHGENSGKRVILFIDAVNEGNGVYFWKDNLNSFIKEIKDFEWLGLVFTVRSSYKGIIFAEENKPNLSLVEHTHQGFKSNEYEASKVFFENYEIDLPSVPLLNPEFQNPLFLKLFCDGIHKAGLTKVPDGLQGITSIIQFFINNVNVVLSNPSRRNYDVGLNLVKKSLDALIKYKADNRSGYLSYEDAFEVVESAVSKFIDAKGFINDLVAEGVLSKNLYWTDSNEYKDGIYFAYERFEDHLTVQYLLEQYLDLDNEFKEGGKLYHYVENENKIYFNKGIIEAFSIQVPEINGRELFEYLPSLKGSYPIVVAFVESLLWRKAETIGEGLKPYINEHVFSYEGTYDLFWEAIISVTAIPNHYFNANRLHEKLMQDSFAERDSQWTVLLKNKYSDESSVKRLIDWSWSSIDKSHISDSSIKLSAITLSWFHTSTNRTLRDSSTKALICLLENRIDVLIDLIEMFKEVNDPFVYERLFSVAYGCSVRTKQKDKLVNLSEFVFKTIFNNPSCVTPHILLRDYARGVIEYTAYSGYQLSFDISETHPPFQSVWPDKISSREELEEKYDNDEYHHLWSSIMSHGDFARYTIGTNHNHSDWSGCKRGVIPTDRKKVVKGFKEGLSEQKLELFDALNPIKIDESKEICIRDRLLGLNQERKTEQELKVAKESFIESLSKEELNIYETEVEPYLNRNHKVMNTYDNFDLKVAQRLIMSRVIELGWSPELHYEFDKQIGTGRGRSSGYQERIGKKYQWIAYYEYLALLSDNFPRVEKYGENKGQELPYAGPWEPYVRDIDPTILIKETGGHTEDKQNHWWSSKEVFEWDCSYQDWITDEKPISNIDRLIQVEDSEGAKWLILESYPTWTEPKKIGEEAWGYPRKEVWTQTRSYIVKNSQFNKTKNWAMEQSFMSSWMPESSNRYEVFSREYYWSAAFKFFSSDYYEGKEWVKLNDPETRDYIADVNITARGYLWEEEFDYSKRETISFLKPCLSIYEGMSLSYGEREGEFINNSGEVVCFEAKVYNNSKSYLLIKKEPFYKYLEENDLEIFWSVLGEKQVVGGNSDRFTGRLEFSGAYFFDGAEIKGKMNIVN